MLARYRATRIVLDSYKTKKHFSSSGKTTTTKISIIKRHRQLTLQQQRELGTVVAKAAP